MKATHQAYARAREALLAAQLALRDAATEHGLELGHPLDDDDEDPLAAEREALRHASETLRAAEAPIAGEIAAAWQRNVAKVQAAKAACEQAIRAALVVEKEIADTVARRRLYPSPAGTALLTEVERHRLTEATQAVDHVIAANRAAEARFKQGVTVEDLIAAG